MPRSDETGCRARLAPATTGTKAVRDPLPRSLLPIVVVTGKLEPQGGSTMTRLVAFLRGVNLGKRQMKMTDLQHSFSRAGFGGAQTVLATGNVVFDGENDAATARRIETQLLGDFGFEVETILRSATELQDMVRRDPFTGYSAGADVKFYVFMLGMGNTDRLELPCAAAGDFEIAGKSAQDIFAVAFRMANGRFGPGLDTLGKPFGRHVTSRNWNTILRILEKASS